MEKADEKQEQLEFQDGEALSCPSFNAYSSDRFAEIAAELSAGERSPAETSNGIVDNDDDFEFALVRSNRDVTADEIFRGGEVRQIFPVFSRDILYNDDHDRDDTADVSTLRLPLKKLFIENREERDPPSSSSSEADELEGIAPGTYCVWKPELVEASPSRCKKSSSTGSASKRWKIRDLLRRSNSEGKDSFVFLTPKNKEKKAAKTEIVESFKERRDFGDAVKGAGKAKAKRITAGGEKVPSSAHELFYIRSRASKEGERRKSYLPYRQDLVGFFASVGRTFPPF
ncbi:hypothetical protein U1Q18_038360 [Sarracenia purpurea var. burkii]